VPAAGKRPHVVFLVADDIGYANLGWLRRQSGGSIPEVTTPNMDSLVRSGINLGRHYTYKVCSPTRSSFQSGRLPVHVNDVNADPAVYNAADPISGFAGIPRNMTCIANKLTLAGYATHQVRSRAPFPEAHSAKR
jgi:arylsulfatase I/J